MEILYQDKSAAVCIKPAGMDSEKELPAALALALGGQFYPVHRLDKAAEGLMVYARTREKAAELSRAMQAGEFTKEYVALVHGTPPEAGDWEDLLWKDSAKNKVYVVKRMRRGVKEARLHYTRLTAGAESLVRVRLLTGRSHQIRVQFASRGFPLVGDNRYGAKDGAAALRLFSCRLAFPLGGKMLEFERLPGWAEE